MPIFGRAIANFRTFDKTHAVLQDPTLVRDCYRLKGSSLLKKYDWKGVYLHSQHMESTLKAFAEDKLS
jgi:hypothetical protein